MKTTDQNRIDALEERVAELTARLDGVLTVKGLRVLDSAGRERITLEMSEFQDGAEIRVYDPSGDVWAGMYGMETGSAGPATHAGFFMSTGGAGTPVATVDSTMVAAS